MQNNLTFGFIGRCTVKGCSTVLRMETPAKTVRKSNRWTNWEVQEACYSPFVFGLRCIFHKWELRWNQIEGVKTDHVCDARCTHAKGPDCECSCGGANHGMNYAV